MENQKDLKWISLVSLGTMSILLLNFAFSGGYYWSRTNLVEAWSYGLTLTYFVLSGLTTSVATLFTSGIRSRVIYRIAVGSFVVSMLFFVLALTSALARGYQLVF